MLTIPLVRLEREGSLEIQAEIPSDDPCWEGTGFRFSTPLTVSGRAQSVVSGEVVVLVRVKGELDLECRRCLKPVALSMERDFDLVFSPVDEAGEPVDETTRVISDSALDLDLAEAIREEVILSQSLLVLCEPDCRGLCPRCGINLNEERCDCSNMEPDPRWDSLRALKEERE
jgi:uncharacterized protein